MAKFKPFEKSPADKEVKGKGKEGSKREEAFDRMQKGKPFAAGGAVRGTGAAVRGKGFKGGC